MQAYLDTSLTTRQKEALLQDIEIGSNSSARSRKLGPTLSRRIYEFFTSTDGTESLQ
jgi:hypothetical protein